MHSQQHSKNQNSKIKGREFFFRVAKNHQLDKGSSPNLTSQIKQISVNSSNYTPPDIIRKSIVYNYVPIFRLFHFKKSILYILNVQFPRVQNYFFALHYTKKTKTLLEMQS